MSQSVAPWRSRSTAIAIVVLWLGCGISLVDALFARSTDAALSLARVWGSDWSLIATLGVPVWIGILALTLFFAMDEPLSLTGSWRRLSGVDPGEARERAVVIMLAALSTLAWLVGTARLALKLFGNEAAPRGNAAILGLVAIGMAWLLFASCVGVARLGVRIYRGPLPSPALALALAFGFLLGSLGLLIIFGETSGAGGAFKMFGVLRRTELDLRAAALLSSWLLLGFWCPTFLRVRANGLTLGALLIPLILALAGYRCWSEETALDVRRGAPLGGLVLPLVWRLTDHDHDGVSAAFGGGDCNDHNAAIYPGAIDVPGNGIDEDCSGADEPVRAEPIAPRNADPEPPRVEAQPQPGLPEKLNVVLVTIDTLRPDLGYMGYARPTSPNIDRLAQRSVVFEHAYSLASYTGKSIGPLLIGRYPSETHRNFGHFNRFGTEDTFIQERLRRVGIHTVSVQGHWYFKEDTGIGRGFDELDLSSAPRLAQGEGDRTVNSDKLSDVALSKLQKLVQEPRQFFLWVHYLDPHAEYVRHPEFDFGKDQRALYDGEIAFTDFHVGRVLSYIENSPLAANTVVILTSDHGEAFGEHGMIRHGFELWEELVRVPLLIHVPGVAARRETTPRSAIDLVPTIYELTGAPSDPADQKEFSGHSLVPDLTLPQGYEPSTRPILVDMCEGPHNEERQAFIDDGKKLTTSMGRPLGLYDLDQDPGEHNNLLSNASLRKEMLDRMNAFKRTLEIVYVPRH